MKTNKFDKGAAVLAFILVGAMALTCMSIAVAVIVACIKWMVS